MLHQPEQTFQVLKRFEVMITSEKNWRAETEPMSHIVYRTHVTDIACVAAVGLN